MFPNMTNTFSPEFASLLSDMWSGKSDVVTPNKFKSAVAKSAPRFVGYRYVLPILEILVPDWLITSHVT